MNVSECWVKVSLSFSLTVYCCRKESGRGTTGRDGTGRDDRQGYIQAYRPGDLVCLFCGEAEADEAVRYVELFDRILAPVVPRRSSLSGSISKYHGPHRTTSTFTSTSRPTRICTNHALDWIGWDGIGWEYQPRHAYSCILSTNIRYHNINGTGRTS
jgi:hypothetical protein